MSEKVTKKKNRLPKIPQLPKNVEMILCVFIGVMVVLLAYFIVYSQMATTNESLRAQVSTLRTEEAILTEYQTNMSANQASIVSLDSEISEIIEQFPAADYEEDAILFASSLEEIDDTISIRNIYFSARNLVDSGSSSGYRLYTNPVQYDIDAGYTSMKNVVTAILSAAYAKNVDNIFLSYDETTGNLTGNMTLNEFSIVGNDQTYTPSDISDVDVGNENPFGSADTSAGTTNEEEE